MRIPKLVSVAVSLAAMSPGIAHALPPGRQWTPVDTLHHGIHLVLGPRLETRPAGRIRMIAAGLTSPQSILIHEWAGDRWRLDLQLPYGSNFLWPFPSEESEEHLVWKGITPVGPFGNDSHLLYMRTLPDLQPAPDTLAVSRGSSWQYAGAASARMKWVLHDDFGNLRLFAARQPDGPWSELDMPGNGTSGVTIAALDDTTALAVWSDLDLLSSAIIRGSVIELIPIPMPEILPGPPKLRRRPSGGYWMIWARPDMDVLVSQFDGASWSDPERVGCAYLNDHQYIPNTPWPSDDDEERPVIAWHAYSTTDNRDVICVSCPTDTGWEEAEELPQINEGFLASPARDENGDVWLAWWKYFEGAFWIHSYTKSEIKDAFVDGAPTRRRVAWHISEQAPKSWWSILRAEGEEPFAVIGRVQAGASHAVEWTDTTAQNVTYQYRIRRDCKDTRYELLSEPIVSDPALIGVDQIGFAWLPIQLSSEVGNPVRGALRLRVEGAAPGAVTVELFDVRGRSLGTTSGTAGSTGVVSFDLGAAGPGDGDARPAGLYFARARDERGRPSRVLKLIVL